MSQASAAYATWPGDAGEMNRVAERPEKHNPGGSSGTGFTVSQAISGLGQSEGCSGDVAGR